MATLYRKYRPQNFAEVVGQNHIKITLEHEIESGKIAHAYIFCGPRAVGKTTMARVLAKAVNCEKRQAGEHEPCNKCANCVDITAGKSFDIIEIDAASHTGVDNVRENIIASARVTPAGSKFKVFIIDEVHMLSASAFNALLKVIEEPPAFVIFILCTTEIHKVPATVISRCQRFDFRRISASDIAKKLEYIAKEEKLKIDRKILEAIARRSEGHMRDAESLLGQVVAIGGKEITPEEADLVIPRSDIGEAISLIAHLAKKDAAAGIRLVNRLIDDGVDLKIFLADLVELLRKVMFAKIDPVLAERLGMELGESLEIKASEAAEELGADSLMVYLEHFMRAAAELRGANIPQLPVELAIVRLCAYASPTAAVSGQEKPAMASTSFKNTSNFLPAKGDKKTAAGEKEKNVADPMTKITHEEILGKWHEVLAKIKKYNHSLSFVLRVCQPRELTGSELRLAFKYKFHKDRINNPGIKALVEKVLAEVYGGYLAVLPVIDETLEFGDNEAAPGDNNPPENGAENGDGNMINNLLKTFGGKIVN